MFPKIQSISRGLRGLNDGVSGDSDNNDTKEKRKSNNDYEASIEAILTGDPFYATLVFEVSEKNLHIY